MTYFEQDQYDQAFMAQEDAAETAIRFRYHVIVDDLANDEAHVLDTHTGKTLTTGTVSECHDYLQSH